jgi:hypothetical protein
MGDHMKLNGNTRSAFLSIFVVFVVSVVAFANSLAAQPPRTTETQELVSVAGHLDLQGMAVKQIFLQQRGNKYYLFLRRVDKNDFAIVDVTEPTKPVLVDRNSLKEPPGGDVEMPSPGSALATWLICPIRSDRRRFGPSKGLPVLPRTRGESSFSL